MKRLSVLFATILLFSASSFASNEYNVLWALNKEATFSKVKNYVNATPEQAQQLDNILYLSTQRLIDALGTSDEESAEKALYFNIANAKTILSPKQYRQYLGILNATYNQKTDEFLTQVSK